ncbi:DUF2269 domain-containing protein [Saccharothrix violaceirubra]|uniref:Putative membrane protein n=1 Tax=Saccharothrix violaceirubra TaxID=413306 RepID=A0A7W7T105_9PSEU|nr:DUF2269 domain-containing protein [Saccharothrix violaceirubra]MBB4964286.1 putative membrane protein [Saccharothrix violaceirubra]
MRPFTRKTLLCLHVVSSVGWLGVTLGDLALGLAAYGDATLYRAVVVLADYALVPLGLVALVTGVVLALGTHWGLAKHWWVLIKLVLTVLALAATTFLLRSAVRDAAAGDPRGALDVVVASSVSLTVYVVSTVLSVFKPRARTRWA